MVTELRFPSTGGKYYVRGIILSLLGIAFLALGLWILTFVSWKLASIPFIAGALFSALLGLALLLLIWFSIVYGTIGVWRRWRQLERPPAVIDADGVCYLAVRRPTRIPWADIEEIHLDRDLLPGSIVTKASVRMTPDAGVLRDGPVKVPRTRYLDLGLLRDASVPEDAAVAYLQETAGPRLRLTETDRRTPSAAHGYR